MKKMRKLSAVLALVMFLELAAPLFMQVAEAVAAPKSVSTQTADNKALLTIDSIAKKYNVTPSDILLRLNEGYSLKHVHNVLAKNPDITVLPATLEELFPGVGKKYEPPAVTDATYGLQMPGFNLPFPSLGDVTGATYGNVTESVYGSRKKRSIYDIPRINHDKLSLVNQHKKLDQAPYSVQTGNETISSVDGSLSLSSTDLFLPGRNGLSFSLRRVYNSNDAEFYKKTVEPELYSSSLITPCVKGTTYKKLGGGQRVVWAENKTDDRGYFVYSGVEGRYSYQFEQRKVEYFYGKEKETMRPVAEVEFPASEINKSIQISMHYDIDFEKIRCSDGEDYQVVPNESYLYPGKYPDNKVESDSKDSILGRGWSWDIPYMKFEHEEAFIRMPAGGVYQVDKDLNLKSYPWKDAVLTKDSSRKVGYVTSAYALKMKQGTTYYFDARGDLIRVEDNYSNFIDFQHLGYGLGKVTDSLGNYIQFSYDWHNSIITATTNANESVKYAFKKFNGTDIPYLESVTNTMGRTTHYGYDPAQSKFSMTSDTINQRNDYALLKAVHHPTGSRTEYRYDKVLRHFGHDSKQEQYRVVERKDVAQYVNGAVVDSNQTSIQYESDPYASASNGRHKTIFKSGDATSTSTYDKVRSGDDPVFQNVESIQQAGHVQHVTNQSYTSNILNPYPAQITSKKISNGVESPSLIVNRNYDENGNVTSETNSLGASTTTTYDAKWGLPETITSKLDVNQQSVTRMYRNDKGSVIESKTYANSEGGQLLGHINYEYDGFGNVTKVTAHNDRGKPTVFRYHYGAEYQHGYLTQQEVDVTNADGQVSTLVEKATYNPVTGQVLSYTDGKQQTTSYVYDPLGRTTLITMPNNSQINYVYNDAQNHVQLKNTLGEVTEAWFDPLGRKVRETKGLGEVKYGYDERTSQLQWTEDAYGNRITYSYDGFGRPLQTTYANNTSDRMEYDDAKLTVTVIDAEQNRSRTTSDVLGRMILVESYQNKQNYVPVQRSEYNLAGAVTSAIDANGNRTEYQYNAGGQLTAVIDAQKQTTSYLYDRLGNLLETIYANQQKMKKEYDELGRVTKKINGTAQVQKYYYDANSNLEKYIDRSGTVTENRYDAMNRPLQNTLGDETVQYSYDTEGRPITMTDHRGTTSYEYQARSGFLTSIQYPDGVRLINNYDLNKKTGYEFAAPGVNVRVDGTYNNVNQLKQLNILSGGNQPAKTISYDHLANGQLAKQTYGNASVTDYQYEDKRLKQLKSTKDGAVQNIFQYGYDLVGNITHRNENSYTTNFTYSPLNQIQTSSEFNETYSYDERYNRQTLDSTRTRSIKSAQYEYDKKNRLTKVTGDHNPVTYSYTGEGLLYERVENNVKSRYYYDANKLLLAEAVVVADGKAKIKYVYLYDLNGKLIGRQDVATSQLQYYQLNGHGDVVAIVDEAGKKLNEYRYDIWGLPLEEKETVPNILKYSGEYWDKTTGLQYLRARWYDPSMGRFISEDTYEGELNSPLSLNLYTYVENNPLKFIDPSGHKAWLIHGTFSDGDTWTSNFVKYVEKLFNEKSEKLIWSGDNNIDARSEAAEGFVTQIYDWHKKHPNDPIRLIGHSHGGNVAIMLSNLLAEKGLEVETLITIATPVREYTLDKNTSVGQHIHLYNNTDQVQSNGGSVWLLGATLSRKFKGAENVRAKDAEQPGVFSPKGGPIDSHSSMHSNINIWKKYIEPILKKKK
ncbi:RHS repeat-associated core domain-containing protein [Paenibacillus assamensis]|uniref:RHS repeat-associated core domain-containing protein n=1 Tax=Paenibacillus assamensis TaxID=311244 RepID=UPI0004073DF4|nr:RHS repeat-associated core domain-containing protein [Paenibacillus assamensis]